MNLTQVGQEVGRGQSVIENEGIRNVQVSARIFLGTFAECFKINIDLRCNGKIEQLQAEKGQ